MPRGGSRPNSGRKPGSLTKRNRAIAEGAAAAGELPLEFMLRTMRDPGTDPLMRADMAKAAAPYCHARLSTTTLKGDPEAGEAIQVVINRFAALDGEVASDPRWARRD